MTITDDQQNRLRELQKVFLEENAKLNLSAIREPEAVWIGNISDSLVALDLDAFAGSDLKILDIGTGGGFPLLPLAICKADCQFVGMDSTQKKLDAIQRMVDVLELRNVRMLSGRCEEKGREAQHRDSYDIVTARAVAPLNVLLEYGAPFVKPGGHLIAWKSMKMDTELEESLLARAELSCHLIESHEYTLPDDWGKRQLLIFEKRGPTDQKYPRETGIPKKNPLL
jgi:16S rRNA (guanine527-N7)-methyltransferase